MLKKLNRQPLNTFVPDLQNVRAQMEQAHEIRLARRSPEDRLAYIRGERREAIARGIHAEIIDGMIVDALSEVGLKPIAVRKDQRYSCDRIRRWTWTCRICQTGSPSSYGRCATSCDAALKHLRDDHGRSEP